MNRESCTGVGARRGAGAEPRSGRRPGVQAAGLRVTWWPSAWSWRIRPADHARWARRSLRCAGVHRRSVIGVREFGDELLDACGEPVDLVAARINLVQQEPGQIGVVVIEATVERFEQRRPLGGELAPGQISEGLGVTLAGDERFDHRPGRHPQQVRRHRRHDQRVLQQPLETLLVPGAFLHKLGPQAGVVPQRTDLPGWHEARSQHPPLVELRQPHRVELVGLGARRPTGARASLSDLSCSVGEYHERAPTGLARAGWGPGRATPGREKRVSGLGRRRGQNQPGSR